jgi:hypothetical protein
VARRVRQSDAETLEPADELRESEGQVDGGEGKVRLRRQAVQVTLSAEVAWRLRTIATMERKAPGEIVEPLIAAHVKSIRLPWDRYKRSTGAAGDSQTPVSAN